MSVFSSISWALAEPVAGLAEAVRLTLSTGRSVRQALEQWHHVGRARPWFAGSSCTQTISVAVGMLVERRLQLGLGPRIHLLDER